MVPRLIPTVFIAAVVSAACSPDMKPSESFITGPPDPIAIKVSGTVTDPAGLPVAGAEVMAVTNRSTTVTTDASGRFDCGSMDYTPNTTLFVMVSRDGYQPVTWQTNSPSGSVVANIKLSAVWTWPNEGVFAGELKPSDPAAYVGEPYDSDYSWNTVYFRYAINHDDDVIIDLEWQPTPNVSLRMWAQDGTLTSVWSGTRQTIRLPKRTSGTLVVGQRDSRLSQPVSFTLSSRRVN